MGMFDTFHVSVPDHGHGRELAVQSKAFACLLDDYRLGDFVEFEQAAPQGVSAFVEDHKQDWRDPACPLEWVVLLIVDGCFLDSFVTDSEAHARLAADTLTRVWAEPERQAAAFKQHARAHHDARQNQQAALYRVARLLDDYAESQRPEPPRHRFLAALRHDFDQQSWDWALAAILAELPALDEHLPEVYRVADALQTAQGEQNPE